VVVSRISNWATVTLWGTVTLPAMPVASKARTTCGKATASARTGT